MKTKLRTLLAFSAVGVSLGAVLPAFAGELDSLHVSVPFAFVAGKINLPAGDYTVSEEMTHVITLKGNHGSAVLIASPGEDREKTGLSFEHTQKGYFLKEVHALGRPSSIVPVVANTGAER